MHKCLAVIISYGHELKVTDESDVTRIKNSHIEWVGCESVA
jgi:hypothetical protein